MDESTARALNDLNRQFYASQATAFSRTRNNSWHGWQRCLNVFLENCSLDTSPGKQEIVVLDAACGNLRFEKWLSEAHPEQKFSFLAVDNCDDLLPNPLPDGVDFVECDLIGNLIDEYATTKKPIHVCEAENSKPESSTSSKRDDRGGDCALALGGIAACDLAVSFGFMHHIPSADTRLSFLKKLACATKPGGCIAVSFWRFGDEPGLAGKAIRSTTQAIAAREEQGRPNLDLDENDFLLGFDQAKDVYRYCHSFTTAEIDTLLKILSPQCEVVDRFRCDGRNGKLNEYVVLSKGAQ